MAASNWAVAVVLKFFKNAKKANIGQTNQITNLVAVQCACKK